MKASKTAIAVAISSAFLFGCDFDIGDENNETTPPPEVTPPPSEVYSIENIYWDMVSDTTALSLSGTQPYLFANDEEGTRALSIYTGDVANGYTFESSSYSAEEEGSVSFDGNQCTYTVADSVLDMLCTKGGVATTYSGTEIEDEDVIEALENATDGKPTTVEEVNAAIASAQDGDTIGLSASGTFDTGIIELNKEVTIDGAGLAKITGDTCIDIQVAGAGVQNLIFENEQITTCYENRNTDENPTGTTAAGNSDNESGVIVIGQFGKDEDKPVVLENLTFNAANITKDDIGPKKASWLFSRGYFTLNDSEFINLSGSFQNNAIRINCSSVNARYNSSITNNEFTIASGGSEVGGIKVGDSSSGKIKVGSNQDCNMRIEQNTFNGYKTLQSYDNGDDFQQTAIHAWLEAVVTDSGKENILK
ncbi:hypothetical protein [Vibrio comitans]|uniref:Lipoprotein n=1 Tax=Vibrio comitans NBRC 102076 TaxID=1219078 RepID=A0A4Y3IKE7_9VIBR|nr:hypothetical protein [Vibrio comitans]GEA59220.1 hypothetical protein VCO01S_04130 [Vibrio comitans NBRC 102076]